MSFRYKMPNISNPSDTTIQFYSIEKTPAVKINATQASIQDGLMLSVLAEEVNPPCCLAIA
jgi:hypothetical protein